MAQKRPAAVRVERERSEFKQLLAANPNYFGNLKDSPLKPVKKVVGNTSYEELTCLGFNPNLNLLEATVEIKRPAGFLGNLCRPGSHEHVRFFADDGAGWVDLGVASFNVHDIPNIKDCAGDPDKPLAYVVTKEFDPFRKFCRKPVLPRVRAILSWETVPDPDPNWPPVWGNVLERSVQVKPRDWQLADIFEVLQEDLGQVVKLPVELAEVQLNPIPLPDPPPLSLPDLVSLYAAEKPGRPGAPVKTSVEPHRFGVEELNAALKPGSLEQSALVAKIGQWQALGLDWAKAITALDKTKGNVAYEELDCLGLDYNREWLVATFRIKKPSGYSGNLCQKGSREHVAFWADWDDTCEWTYLGTVSIEVHDIAGMPADGLHYAAILPVNLSALRRPCANPKIGRVRAVLSWNTSPSTSDPDAVPHWGNRVDSHVQIRPGDPVVQPEPIISILGGIPISEIDTAISGLTTATAKFALTGHDADSLGRPCPFGRRVAVQGPPFVGYKYRVWVHRVGSADPPQLVTTPIRTVDLNGVGTWRFPAGGFFTYLDNMQNIINLLAWWDTSGDDQWEIQLEIATGGGVVLGSSAWHRIQLDNTAPTAMLTLDGGACNEFTAGEMITGRFVARDTWFGSFSLTTRPVSLSPPNPTTGTPSTSQTALPPGDVWQLNTAGMQTCGYVVQVDVWDRSVLNSSPGGHNHALDDKGFCLVEAE